MVPNEINSGVVSNITVQVWNRYKLEIRWWYFGLVIILNIEHYRIHYDHEVAVTLVVNSKISVMIVQTEEYKQNLLNGIVTTHLLPPSGEAF